jgi:hypothetical protein
LILVKIQDIIAEMLVGGSLGVLNNMPEQLKITQFIKQKLI